MLHRQAAKSLCYNAAVEEASVSENCCIGTRIAHALIVGVSEGSLAENTVCFTVCFCAQG